MTASVPTDRVVRGTWDVAVPGEHALRAVGAAALEYRAGGKSSLALAVSGVVLFLSAGALAAAVGGANGA